MLSALQGEDYGACLHGQHDNYSMPIVLDNGASTSIMPIIGDLFGPLEPAQASEIKGLSSTTCIVGKGTIEWAICDYWNVVQVIQMTA